MSILSEHIPSYMPRWRQFKDNLATGTITAGGACVLMALLLIFFYLVYEVVPLFTGAGGESRDLASWDISESGQSLYLALEEQGKIALRISEAGDIEFMSLRDGTLRKKVNVRNALGQAPVIVAEESPQSRIIGLGYPNGEVLLVKAEYRLTYPDDQLVVTPRIEYPYGDEPLQVGDGSQGFSHLAVRDGEAALVIAAALDTGELLIERLNKEEDFLSGEVTLEREQLSLPPARSELSALHLGIDQRWIYQLQSAGEYLVYDLSRLDGEGTPVEAERGNVGHPVSASVMLLGGISLLVADTSGGLAQFFMVREGKSARLQRVREFDTNGHVITHILPEHRRKGFIAFDDQGGLQVFHSTSRRTLMSEQTAGSDLAFMAISPRAKDVVLHFSDGSLQGWKIDNEHPEISWGALWSKVWYESYPEPEYTWQSSASNNDFEPKYSFSPLAFGTLKAAFYAMLMAAPLAICGAIYTAYFMAPALRKKVKPLIELMEALPTVILGFLAGLWLAPFVEANLTGVFSVFVFMPIGVLLFSFAWSRVPLKLRTALPEGWQALILIPVVCLIGYLCFAMNDRVELLFFGGDMRVWVTTELGVSFDQRNALVVGIAMGLAVIPTIFSISEDAIFSVPRHLSYGSLALGATPWQTLIGVVLPTASPGIFSGLMIGMGRAVGETMIVLMATGNTPIMDANIFEGMRTLAANIAVEIPEAEVDSTHYRILFLAAFVLFAFTFMVNTAAELIRQRLRVRYGSL